MKKVNQIKYWGLLLIACVLGLTSFAQDVTVPNVSPKVKKFKGVQDIEGLGYYCFVMDDKASKGNRVFKLYVWDYDLNELGVAKILLEKKSEILDAVFNGENFLVSFYDRKSDNVKILTYTKEGKKLSEKVADGIKTRFMEMEDFRPSFYSAGKDGFYGIIPDKEKKFGFTVIRYDNKLKKLWSNTYFPEKGMQVVMDAMADEDKLVVLKYSKGSKFSRVVDVDMTAFSSGSGDKLWSYDLNSKGKVLMPTELAINSKGNVAVGGIYFEGDKIKALNSDGVFFAHVDAKGNEIALSNKAWAGDLQAFIKSNKSSITLGKPKVIFEEIIYSESSDEFKIIGEMYTVGTAGKVMSMLSNNPDALTKVTIEDLMVFTFGSDGEMKDLYSINKARTNIWIPQAYSGGINISWYLKQTGSLPFKFASLDQSGDVIAYFIDYVKLDESGKLVNQKIGGTYVGIQKLGVGMLNISKSSIEDVTVSYLPISKKTGKIDENSDVEFDSKRSIINVTRSKPGYVLISEFSKKTENLNLFLEEIE